MSLTGAADKVGAFVASHIIVFSSVAFHYDEALNVRACSGAAFGDGIKSIELAGDDVLVHFPVGFFKSYVVENRDDLNCGSWTTLATTNSAACTGEAVHVADEGAATKPQRFYRLRASNQDFARE